MILGHMGNEAACKPWTYADVIAHTSGIDVFLDGHSHDTDLVTMKNASGKDVVRAACGTKLEHIGWCRITADGEIKAGLFTWSIDIPAPKLFKIENEAARMVDAATKKMATLLSEVVCGTAVNLMSDDPLETDFNGQAVRMIRVTETNMGDLAADAFRVQGCAEIALINSGGVRKNIEAGDITYGGLLKTWPYNSYLCVLEATGRQILDALELGAALAPVENGNFLQVSGLTLEIHTYIPSGVVTDADGMFVRVEGERRVKNVLVNGKPIDPGKTYILAGRDFMLTQYGGGFTMFKGAKVLQDSVKVDTQVMADYINETLGGIVGAEYEDPYGQGRITIVEKPE